MGAAIQLSDAPFRDVVHALNSAYAEESRVICKIGTAIADMRGGTVKVAAPMTPHDRLAQASFTLSLMRRSLPQSLADVLDAYYTVPDGITLEGRKEGAIRTLSFRLWEDMGGIPHRWYLCDVTRGWSRHNKRDHDDAHWADRAGVTARTLRNWRVGWHGHTGALTRLDALLGAAHSRVWEVFQEAGLCD